MRLRIFFVLILFVICSAAWGVEPQLYVQTERNSFAPYEPVLIQYFVKNLTRVPIEIQHPDFSTEEFFKIQIADEKEFFAPFVRPREPGPEQWLTLQPQEKLVFVIPLVANADEPEAFQLRKPGKYSLKFLIRYREGGAVHPLESRVLNIIVREWTEQNKAELEALGPSRIHCAMLGGDPARKHLKASASETSASAADSMEFFLRTYSSSPYAPHVRMELAKMYATGSGAAANSARSVVLLQELLKSPPVFLREKALLQLAKVYLAMGKKGDAKDKLNKLKDEAPYSIEWRNSAALKQRLK